MDNISTEFNKNFFGPQIRVIVLLEENTRQLWEFEYDPRAHSLKNRSFYFQKRETPRHKWVTKDKFEKPETRSNTLHTLPEIPPEVRAVARDRFIQELTTE